MLSNGYICIYITGITDITALLVVPRALLPLSLLFTSSNRARCWHGTQPPPPRHSRNASRLASCRSFKDFARILIVPKTPFLRPCVYFLIYLFWNFFFFHFTGAGGKLPIYSPTHPLPCLRPLWNRRTSAGSSRNWGHDLGCYLSDGAWSSTFKLIGGIKSRVIEI